MYSRSGCCKTIVRINQRPVLMPRRNNRHGAAISALLLGRVISGLLLTMFLAGCNPKVVESTVSETPPSTTTKARALARTGRIGMSTRISYETLEALAEQQLPAKQHVIGERRVCKRLLGINACGTAQWDITLLRKGKPRIKGKSDRLQIALPLVFNGNVGVKGKMAKAFRLQELDVNGEAYAIINIGMQMQENWCPALKASVSYEWTKQPRIAWQAGLDFSLESIINKALDDQLTRLEPRLNEAINCDDFRNQLSQFWRAYSFPLSLPGDQTVHLNIDPQGFAFSGIVTAKDELGLSFALDANTIVDAIAGNEDARPLPALKTVEYASETTRTSFNLLLRARYEQLEDVLNPVLIGKQYSSETPAGKVSMDIESIELSGNDNGLTVSLGFTAKIPATRSQVNGIVHMTAVPVVDRDAQTLRLENVRMTRILDSRVWSALGELFETQIINAIENKAIINLAARTQDLEEKLLSQLNDPERTRGLKVSVSDLSISLHELVVEADALAAVTEVTSIIDIEIPLEVVKRQQPGAAVD